MKIKEVAYIGSYGHEQPFPEGLGPEFVFMGRSNVGKSSLINALLNRKNIARTSNTPGKTRTANFYTVNAEFCFVDMPGYGYAQVSKAERARWQKLIKAYLSDRKTLKGIVHLLDVRHKPSKEDHETSLTLHGSEHPVCFVFNKIDKIKTREIDSKVAGHLDGLAASAGTAVVPLSTQTGVGRQAVWAWIRDCLSL
jgi:GTP-binding protein